MDKDTEDFLHKMYHKERNENEIAQLLATKMALLIAPLVFAIDKANEIDPKLGLDIAGMVTSSICVKSTKNMDDALDFNNKLHEKTREVIIKLDKEVNLNEL